MMEYSVWVAPTPDIGMMPETGLSETREANHQTRTGCHKRSAEPLQLDAQGG
jgi:hypothetical protein